MKIVIMIICVTCLTATRVAAVEPFKFESGQAPATLIELYTSEGCSSCPPAEKWFSKFKTDPGLWKTIVPAAFHVDYWDHLGWSDRFAKAEFTERQRHYGSAWRSDWVYTPGFAVDGNEWKGWFNGSSLPHRDARVGILRITLTPDNTVTATFNPEQPSARGYVLQTALLGSDRESNILRGENTGRKLRHDFVVLQFSSAPMTSRDAQWSGAVTFQSAAGPNKPDAIAAWVIPADGYQPIQATGGWIQKQP